MPSKPGTALTSVLDIETNSCTSFKNFELAASFAAEFHEDPRSHASKLSSDPAVVDVDT
jgi:hypothetical protein